MLTLHMELTALSCYATSTACCKESCHIHTKTPPSWAGVPCHDAGAGSKPTERYDMQEYAASAHALCSFAEASCQCRTINCIATSVS